jgi:hypothetical protein
VLQAVLVEVATATAGAAATAAAAVAAVAAVAAGLKFIKQGGEMNVKVEEPMSGKRPQ